MDTLRAGERKCQSSKEQFRWKIGTAPAWIGGGTNGRSRSVKPGSAESLRLIAATACRSVPEDGRGAAGVEGARLSAGLAQHAGVAHLAGSKSQHLQTGVDAEQMRPASARETPGQPVAMASSRASSADEVLCDALAMTV